MGLNKRQQEAVEYLNGPLLVLAGPGTGKTELLSEKVAYILNNTDALPENILCLTFTDAGANNMRERLLSIVGPTAGKVNIHTYHAFGSDILSMYKNYAEYFDRNLDDPIDSVTQYKIIKKIISELPATDILKTSDETDIIATISEAKSARLTPDDLILIAKTNIKDSEEMNPRLSAVLETIERGMKYEDGKKIYIEAENIIAEYFSDKPIVKKVYKEANAFITSLEQVMATEEAKEKPSIQGLTKWRNSLFEKDSNGDYRLKNYIANKKLLSLASVYKKYEEYLEENHLFDFTDMIEQAVRMLQEDSGFRFTLQERFQYILLDEFQDTNPSQYELIRLISATEKPDIMAVGDDDQAIFAFQGANVSNLLDFQKDYNAHRVVLTDNYRSTSEILEISRKIADKIEGSFVKLQNEIGEGEKIEKNLVSIRNDDILNEKERDIPQVIRHEFKASDSEYAFVADKISELIDSGVKQGEIAVITPKHKYITPLLPYLKAHKNINISYEKRENILEDERIHELNILARFIYELSKGENPSYRLLEILTFPFFEVPAIDAITSLNSYYGDTRKALDYLKDSGNEKLKNIAVLLAELTAKSFDTPLELFIDYLIGTAKITTNENEEICSNFLKFYENEKVDFSTYSLYENLSVLREKIKSHVRTEKPRLKDYIDFLDDYEEAGELILNTSPYQDASDSVQVLTAYKSKGLQYTHVFIIATDDSSWGNSKGNNNKLTLPKNLEMIRHTGQTEDECIRLFFVALTRAKKTITLTSSKQDFSGKAPKRLEYLEEYEVNDEEVCSPLLRNTNVVEHYDELSEDEKKDNLEKNWMSSYLVLNPDLKSTLEKSTENFRMTASALTSFIDIVYAGPISFYKTYIIHGPSEPATGSMEFGTLIHSVFENVTNKKLSDEEALNYFSSEVEKLDLTDEDKKDIIERGEIAVKESLKAFKNVFIPENLTARAEVNLSAEHLTYNGIPITGKIDHINIDEEKKEIEIYDFKTSGFHKEKWESHPTLYKYQLQLLFYKLLLNMSPTYSKYKVTRAHILFVSPSVKDIAINELEKADSELVHDKIYEFNDKEENDFKTLLESVYKHVKSLDFVDENSPLAIFPDDSRRIKDIKEFVELITDGKVFF